MLEKEIERKLRKRVTAMGGLCVKFESPGNAGVPDRLILLPGGIMAFVELKAPGKHERPLQRHVQDKLRELGFTVFSSVDSDAQIDRVVSWATLMVGKATRLEGLTV
ncbi:MAG: VRR-NUC domain-containing protein [Clostridiales bacterium]|nr:VRR-NUC domain-containing protein [Clostridiales bacterium]